MITDRNGNIVSKSIKILWHLARARVNPVMVNVSVEIIHMSKSNPRLCEAGAMLLPLRYEFFSTVPGWFFDMCIISTGA